MAGIRHRHTATGADDPEAEVNRDEWNDTHLVDTLDLTPQTSDPASPTAGQIWYRAGGVYARLSSSTVDLAAPDWSRVGGKPTTMAGYGIGDGLTATAAAAAYQPLSAVLTATTASYTTAEQAKLAGIADGATANATDAALRDRSTHTGTQAAGTITGLATVAASGDFADLTGKPTSLAGYGITDSGAVPWVTPVSGGYMMTTVAAPGTGTLAGAAGRIDLFPFTFRGGPGAITGWAINCATPVASALARILVYDADPITERTANKIFESGNLDLSTAGVKDAPDSRTLVVGATYWLGVHHSSTATITAWAAGATPDINGGNPATTLRKTVRRTAAVWTSPSIWGWSEPEISNGLPPAIWIKV